MNGQVSNPRILLAATGWLTVLAVMLLPADSPARLVPVCLFLAFAPGAALQLPLRAAMLGGQGTSRAEFWLATVLLSLSTLVLVAVGLMLAGGFTPLTTLVVLSVVTTAASLLPALRDSTDPAGTDTAEN